MKLKKSIKKAGIVKKQVKKVAETVPEEVPDEIAEKIEGEVRDSEVESDDDEVVGNQKGGMKKHKLDLEKLAQTDPEFFKFLQQEDADLLNLQEEEDDDGIDEEDLEDEELELDEENEEDDEDSDENDEIEGKEKKKVRKPKAKTDHSTGRLIVDSTVYSYLQQVLALEDENTPIDASDAKMAIDVFVACVARVGANIEAPKYIINEQSIFEAVIRLCFQAMPHVLHRLLNAKKDEMTGKIAFSKTAIKKYQNCVRTYLHAMIVFLNEVQTVDVISSSLKAITRLVDVYAHFARMTKLLIKSITRVWSRKTLECRLSAFVCMNLLVKNYPQHFVLLYKTAYVSFVANSKIVTNETWPLLQFMHRTFAELTLLYPDEAYKYAFVYIRQTAVHLRNAMIAKGRKDLIFSIYNWQMMQCMYIWVRVIARSHSVNGAESIAELVYPLIQVILGIFRLCNAPTFLPLRLHCCQLLIQLQASCTNYVPILQFSCDTLEELVRELKTKPKPSKGAVKIPDIECTLKISSQFTDLPQWRKTACESVFRVMIQAAHLLSSNAAFSDVILPINHRISSILENVKNSDYTHLFRGLQTKLKEHSKFVLDVLARKDVRLNDEMQIRATMGKKYGKPRKRRLDNKLKNRFWRRRAVKKKRNLEIIRREKRLKVTKMTKLKKKNRQFQNNREKRAKIGAAAKKADSTIPDKFGDLDNWSDED
ncbi:unnamed protein product [Caenorhabditis angaria]|uniref:Nucleolar complex protein 2 homolog n=1 Tax=Caenorhabditis angaria TaxID=860376 RepID=A0A9P1N0D3_9PELO|nr:unnamed protein product [Caenorhabditis angaria]